MKAELGSSFKYTLVMSKLGEEWRALNERGKKAVRDFLTSDLYARIEASDAHAAVELLRRDGLFVSSMSEAVVAPVAASRRRITSRGGGRGHRGIVTSFVKLRD